MLSAQRRSPQRNRASAQLEMILRAWSRRDPVSTRGQEPFGGGDAGRRRWLLSCALSGYNRGAWQGAGRVSADVLPSCACVRVRVELRGHGRASASSDFASNQAGSARGAAPA